MKISRFALLALVPALSPLRADEVASLLRPVALQGGSSQAEVGEQTTEIARELARLRAELERNGFPKESLGGLDDLVKQLDGLGGEEMRALAEQLRAAAGASGDVIGTVADVYASQQGVQARLNELSHQLVLQKLREQAIRRLEQLILRQQAAQRETRAIAAAKNSDGTRHRLLVSDQTGIGRELAAFLDTGDTLLSKLRSGAQLVSEPATAEPSFAEKVNAPRLNSLAAEAVSGIEAKRYPEAFQSQQALLDELRRLLQAILSSQSQQQRLSSALQQLAALQQQAGAKPQDPQTLADQAALLAAQVAPLNDAAAKKLQPPTPSAPPSKAAMQAAQQSLQQQLAEARQTAQTEGSRQRSAQAEGTQEQAAQAEGRQEQTNQADGGQERSAQAEGRPSDAGQAEGPQRQTAQAEGQQRQQKQKQPPMSGSGTGAQPPPDTTPSMKPGETGYGEVGGLIAGIGGAGDKTDLEMGALPPQVVAEMNVLQSERAPAEYSAWIGEYWRKLAEER